MKMPTVIDMIRTNSSKRYQTNARGCRSTQNPPCALPLLLPSVRAAPIFPVIWKASGGRTATESLQTCTVYHRRRARNNIAVRNTTATDGHIAMLCIVHGLHMEIISLVDILFYIGILFRAIHKQTLLQIGFIIFISFLFVVTQL